MLQARKPVVVAVSLVAVFIGLLVFGGAYYGWQYRRCLVVVENASGHALRNVTVTVRGGRRAAVSHELGELQHGQRRTIRIFPPGEGVTAMSFIGENNQVVQGPEVYVESTGGYRVYFRVGSGDRVQEEDILWGAQYLRSGRQGATLRQSR